MVSIKKGFKKIADKLHDENDKITSKLFDDKQQDSNREEIDNDYEVDSWDKLKEEIETKIVDTTEKTDDQSPLNEQTQKTSQNMSKEEEQKIISDGSSIFWIILHNPHHDRDVTVGGTRGKDIIHPQLMLTS